MMVMTSVDSFVPLLLFENSKVAHLPLLFCEIDIFFGTFLRWSSRGSC